MFSLLLLLLLPHSVFLASSCPDGWQDSDVVDGKCYLFVTERDTWLRAENYCKSVATDGHLTSITSSLESTDIFSDADHLCDHYWIGLNDIGQTGNFTWIDGSPLTYTDWDAGQPNSGGDKQCVSANGQTNGKWVTEFCGLDNCFVCESNQPSGITTPSATTPSSETTTTTLPTTNMTDCYDWYTIGLIRRDGIYRIEPPGSAPFDVWCDMNTDGGGWTVIQRRRSGVPSFFDRTWYQYKWGFDNGIENNMWLGNEYIHILSTKDANVELRIDIMGDTVSNSQYAYISIWQKQSSFWIEDEANNYTLHVSQTVQGNASISDNIFYGINYNDGLPFSTIDNSHDKCNGCCTQPPSSFGGWWLRSCTYSSLNGKYNPTYNANTVGFLWHAYDYYINPKQSRMMIRRVT